MMSERAQFLEQELFLLDDKLRDPILSIREECFKISTKLDLIDISFD